MISPADEGRRAPTGADFADAVTISWADAERRLYGVARLGLAQGEDGVQGSALAVLFRDREPVAALAQSSLPVPDGADWTALELTGLRTATVAPLDRWTVRWDGTEQGFELEAEAISAPAEIGADDAVARLGGMAGYEQLVAVRGSVRIGDETLRVDGLGQRGHSWGVADWSSLALVRTLSAWLGDEHGGVMLQSLRPQEAGEHDGEATWAALVQHGEPAAVAEPRLSTTYDGDGHQRRAGLELWVTEDGYPYRAAGEVLCGSSIDLGSLRLDLAFMRWHAQGVTGVGRYDVLRRAD